MVIRSYVRVFKVERRLYPNPDPGLHPVIQMFYKMIPPSGIPLTGFWYYLGLLIVSLVLWALPVIGLVWGVLPWPMLLIVLPLFGAGALCMFSPDGRPSHLFLLTWLQLTARRVWARVLRPSMDVGGKLRVRYDASGVELHRAQIKGPATVAFAVPVETQDRWNAWCAEGGQGKPQTVAVRADQTLRINP